MGEETVIKPVSVVSPMVTHCLSTSDICDTSDAGAGLLSFLCEGKLRPRSTAGPAHSNGYGRGVASSRKDARHTPTLAREHIAHT